ncbi:MAG TPA: carotenoid biosynthesis protein [Sphingomicrobium sp.]|nr:carotenoid biosynthesis protein [Sphingomicrobium sp.]
MILWTIVVLYLAVIFLRPVGLLPASLYAPLSALLPMAFALIHGSKHYGWRDMLVFAAVCLVVSNAFENLSILTGFPFGHYHYSDNLGPKLFLVPLLIGPAYLGMGYLSWTVARLILGGGRAAADRVFALPAVAGFVMVAWDLTFDPVASTISGSWVWHDGGAYFGVPVSNFLGWYLAVYLFFQLFALYRGRRPAQPPPATSGAPIATTFWWPALAMYAATALRPVVTLLFLPVGPATVTDPAGVTWNVEALYGVCALAGIFTMGAFVMLALLRLTERVNGGEGRI